MTEKPPTTTRPPLERIGLIVRSAPWEERSGREALDLALAAAVGGAGALVLVVEERPMPSTTTDLFDGRVTAIARGVKQALPGVQMPGGLVVYQAS